MPIFSRQTCEADPSLYPIVLGSLPAYRDADTRDSFVHLGTFFGCVDLCEKEYELKRVLYPLPGVALGESVTEKHFGLVYCWIDFLNSGHLRTCLIRMLA